MSLTTQLYNGEIGRWCAEHLQTGSAIAHVQRQLIMAGSPEPVRPVGKVNARHWADVGGAFGARLALLVDGAPPYYALLGAVRAGLASRRWSEAMHTEFRTHRETPGSAQGRWSQYRPGRRGWIDIGERIESGEPTEHEPVLSDFVRRTAALIDEHMPPGRIGAPGAESSLARSCWVIAGWETSYREGRLPADLAAVHSHPDYTAADLRRVVREPVLAELVDLVRVLHTRKTVQTWRGAGHRPDQGPLGISGPVFVPHWADGDLIVGDTLLDVKTAIRVDNPDSLSRWLWQILCYAWLDVQDMYEIRSVGLYLARHGVTASWGIDAFESSLLGGSGRATEAREDFLRIARRVIRDEGAHPPGAWRPRRKDTLHGH
ncbi:hypothetical protein [Amycolatopsis thailandensis]|uniref:hypothetical protein n=1 Tax=Amycolatopsis thailandensis TaxID=589330 RepID=UPI00362F5668